MSKVKSEKITVFVPEEMVVAEPKNDGGNITQIPVEKPAATPSTISEKVRVRNRKHPSEYKYAVGKMNYDLNKARVAFLSRLTEKQSDKYFAGTLVLDPEKTKSFLNEIKKDDIVGLYHTAYKVIGKTTKTLVVADKSEDGRKEFSLPEVDNALAMGFGEILYRDGKPFGMDEFTEVEVVIKKIPVPPPAEQKTSK